jgi:hypothetical protein
VISETGARCQDKIVSSREGTPSLSRWTTQISYYKLVYSYLMSAILIFSTAICNVPTAICNVESTRSGVPSITEVKQHWAQSVLGSVTAYKRVNHTKDWLALLLARCCIASWVIDLYTWKMQWRDAVTHRSPWWLLGLETCVWITKNPIRDACKQTNKQTFF